MVTPLAETLVYVSVQLKPSGYGSRVVSSLFGLLPALHADRNIEFHSLGQVEST